MSSFSNGFLKKVPRFWALFGRSSFLYDRSQFYLERNWIHIFQMAEKSTAAKGDFSLDSERCLGTLQKA